MFVSCCNEIRCCIHIETANLADGTYELVPTHEANTADAQVNTIELIQDPNQSSEEPKASSAKEASPGASNAYYFLSNLCNLCCNLFICVFTFRRWLKP